MKRTSLNLATISIPLPIRNKLRDLSRNIEFTKQSRKGSNGYLFFGFNRITRQEIAVKFYDWSGVSSYHAEPRNLAAIESDNVIKILDASFVDRDYAYFLTPYYTRGDLDGEICGGLHGNLRAVSVIRDILSGLSFLHAESLLHRDLKPQNVLIADNLKAVIGDFGSVKKLPEGESTVPGSGHSLIYTPPESISTGSFGVPGDIYQVGLTFFQMLGGFFPYEESAWLNSQELRKYRKIGDAVDRQLYASKCIKRRIEKGAIIDQKTLPPWVCKPLRRTISKACNIEPSKRYQSCSEFLARLNAIRMNIHDWRIAKGCPVRYGTTKYRIVLEEKQNQRFVEKKITSGWRRDNSFKGTDVQSLVNQIERTY